MNIYICSRFLIILMEILADRWNLFDILFECLDRAMCIYETSPPQNLETINL